MFSLLKWCSCQHFHIFLTQALPRWGDAEMPHVPSDKPSTFGSNWTGEREGFLLAFAYIIWFILGWNFWEWGCITLTNSGCYRKYRIIWVILHIQTRPEYWQLPGKCWGKRLREGCWDTCIVRLVISCLVFVTFTLAIVIIMCSLQEPVWAVTSAPFCTFHLQFHLGQDDVWEQPE